MSPRPGGAASSADTDTDTDTGRANPYPGRANPYPPARRPLPAVAMRPTGTPAPRPPSAPGYARPMPAGRPPGSPFPPRPVGPGGARTFPPPSRGFGLPSLRRNVCPHFYMTGSRGAIPIQAPHLLKGLLRQPHTISRCQLRGGVHLDEGFVNDVCLTPRFNQCVFYEDELTRE